MAVSSTNNEIYFFLIVDFSFGENSVGGGRLKKAMYSGAP